MYPDLSYLFYDLFGTDPDNWTSIFKTFGLLLAITSIVSAFIVRIEFIRKEKEGVLKPVKVVPKNKLNVGITEALVNGLFFGIAGCKVPYISQNFTSFKKDPASIIFSTQGNWLIGIVLAILVGGYFYWKYKDVKPSTETRLVYPHEKVMDIIVTAFVLGIVGSRMFSIFENFGDFLSDPIGQLFSGSGLTIYGGLITCFVVMPFYVRRLGIPAIHVIDAAAPALALGYGTGRLGCHFSGDGDWGIDNLFPKPDWFIFPDWAWAYDYPRNVLGRGVPIEDCVGFFCNRLENPVYPTPIWEAIISAIILGLLWFLRKKIKIAGMLFFIYLILNGIARFFIEGIRINERYDVLGMELSLSQFIGVGFVLVGIIGVIYLKNNGRTMESYINEGPNEVIA